MALPTAIPIDRAATAVTAVVSASSMTHTQAHAAEVKIGSHNLALYQDATI